MRIAEENWKVLGSLFPAGWQQMAWQSGAVERLRGFPSPDVLLRVLLLHVARGYSLRETVVRAKLANWADISDVALLKRLRSSEEWLRFLCMELVLMCWFASTLRVSWRTLHAADGSPSFRDYALCPKWGSSANGGLFCTVKVRRLPAGCAQYERATARFNKLIGACCVKQVRSK